MAFSCNICGPTWPETKKSGALTLSIKRLRKLRMWNFQRTGVCIMPIRAFRFTARVLLDQDFCIDPHCAGMYLDCNPTEPTYYQNTRPKCILFSVYQFLMNFKGLTFSNTAMVLLTLVLLMFSLIPSSSTDHGITGSYLIIFPVLTRAEL